MRGQRERERIQGLEVLRAQRTKVDGAED